ncbi:hypothetical protein D3C80_2048170 [compost metagenome]
MFIPKSPATNPNLWVVEKIEASLRELPTLIEEAVAKTETITLEAGKDVRGLDDQAINEDWF